MLCAREKSTPLDFVHRKVCYSTKNSKTFTEDPRSISILVLEIWLFGNCDFWNFSTQIWKIIKNRKLNRFGWYLQGSWRYVWAIFSYLNLDQMLNRWWFIAEIPKFSENWDSNFPPLFENYPLVTHKFFICCRHLLYLHFIVLRQKHKIMQKS